MGVGSTSIFIFILLNFPNFFRQSEKTNRKKNNIIDPGNQNSG
jgi:hypothetical protein